MSDFSPQHAIALFEKLDLAGYSGEALAAAD
jgi:hypothetical protein